MPAVKAPSRTVKKKTKGTIKEKKEYERQAERLGQYTAAQEDDSTGSTRASEAKFVTAQDPVIETENGGRLPAVPLDEAVKLNELKDVVEGRRSSENIPAHNGAREAKDGTIHGTGPDKIRTSEQSTEPEAPLRSAAPPSRTNPLFPPLPLYGPPTLMRNLQCIFFRTTSFFLSLGFLMIIVLGAAFTSIPRVSRGIFMRLTFRDPASTRPFYEEEKRRRTDRIRAEKQWRAQKRRDVPSTPASVEHNAQSEKQPEYIPTEGGPDPLICDIGHYARREGLDVETFQVQTEDGFIIELQHLYNPLTHTPATSRARAPHSPNVFTSTSSSPDLSSSPPQTAYPILLLHGLLQSSGAYCCTGPSSLAFHLAKSGYDIWLGNNRCGMTPRHTLLSYSDPRMWAWNIRQMGVLDLTALVSRVLSETGSAKLALVAHSQGTTQTLVALAKEQRPELGRRISVFCALAPAAYAGPLIGKAYFKFMRVISPGMFKMVFGIHAFIPFMMAMHRVLPGKFYGDMGYLVFSFLFNWSDVRWEKDLRARCFQFAPTFVSAESMRWWLGRECFATQKCILATREEGRLEDREDEEEDEVIRRYYEGGRNTSVEVLTEEEIKKRRELEERLENVVDKEERGRYAWYDDNFPPLAMWVCGADDLVDGRRLLRRFDRGREPHVRVVYKKIIEGYEHLDVIWAMDCIDKVGEEIKQVVWKSLPADARKNVKVPIGCEHLAPYDLDIEETKDMNLADRIASVQDRAGEGSSSIADSKSERSQGPISPTQIDTTAGEWTSSLRSDVKGK